MHHSIVIPNRDYNRYLDHCLWSIQHSAATCGVDDYEVIVVDQGSTREDRFRDGEGLASVLEEKDLVSLGDRVRVFTQPRSKYFNKPRAQNEGIERARGDVLSFLDADTLVGPRWMENIAQLDRLGPNALTKLCYRVRYLPEETLGALDAESAEERRLRIESWCHFAESLPIAFEGYGQPETDRRDATSLKPIFGNSQFSIKRIVLGELRFDEAFEGRGYEDLWMNREIWRHYRDDYRAGIVTDPEHALLHIRNPYPATPEALELWGPGKQNGANEKRYRTG